MINVNMQCNLVSSKILTQLYTDLIGIQNIF